MKDKNRNIEFLCLITALSLSIVTISSIAFAYPVINHTTFSPSSDIWIGENMTISVNCTDNQSLPLNVTAQIAGEDGYTIPNKTFELKSSGLYEAIIESLYMNIPESFSVNISCTNNESVNVIQTTGFTVSNFSAIPLSSTPIFTYLGDQIEINLNVTKNNSAIIYPSDLDFIVKLNNEEVQPKINPPYYSDKGWTIYLDSPLESIEYDVEILASYGRANDIVTTTMTVEDPIQFSIMTVDNDLIEPGDEINIDIEAFDRGSIISLNTENLRVDVGSSPATIKSINPVSNYFRIKIEAPNHSPGTCSLTASLTSGNYTYPDSETVHYAVPISGDFTTEGGSAISASVVFSYDGVQRLTLNTDSDGSYSSKIQPGTYEIQFAFPESVLKLEGVDVFEFEDPINYYYSTSADVVAGLKVAGLHVYETTLSFSEATIEMRYNEDNVLDEKSIKVYKCVNWNAGKRECYSTWNEIGASIDTVKNVVTVETGGLSAYAIGSMKGLSINYELSKEEYYLKDVVRIIGVTRDTENLRVDNVSVRLHVVDTVTDMTTYSDRNGEFSLEFISPNMKGTYTLLLGAEKSPYIHSNVSTNLEIVKSTLFSIVFPETIQMKQGEDRTYEVLLKNIGQIDLYNFNISLTGLPEGYHTSPDLVKKLKIGEEKRVSISFSIPENANLGTSSVTLKIFSNDLTKEKIVGFTILSKNQTNESTTIITRPTGFFGKVFSNLPMPKLTLPEITTETTYALIALFAISAFALAIFFRSKRSTRAKRSDIRDEVKSNLFDLKRNIGMNVGEPKGSITSEMSWPKLREKWSSVGDRFGG